MHLPRRHAVFGRHVGTIRRNLEMRLRPLSLPKFWLIVTRGRGIETHVQKRDWILVLNSCGIDFVISKFGGQEHIYAPPMQALRAKRELDSYISENAPRMTAAPAWQLHPHSRLAAFFLLPLLFLHGLIAGWWPTPSFLPPPDKWPAIGELNSLKILVYGQWERLVTALTLHADLKHLSGNILFGGIFLSFLARLTGLGRAVWLTLLGGVGGNLASVLIHDPGYRSVGFSTAIFACIGIMAGIALGREADKRRLFMPVAAGLALLALLGTSGEHTDYTAHLSGFGSGCILGILDSWRLRHGLPAIPGKWAGLLGIVIPILAWSWAFCRI